MILQTFGTVLALAVSWLLTGAMRRYALNSALMDTPNERSSHKVPTPRGGGVAIVITYLCAMAALGAIGWLSFRLVVTVLAGGALVATLGFIDDRRGLPARVRFVGHAVAAIWVLFWLGDIPPVTVFGHEIQLHAAGTVLVFLFLTWMINLFNFMDGIDGLAGTEAVSICLGGSVLWYAFGDGSLDWLAGLLFAASVAGFLIWNLPPAKIFMGDAGSGFIGFVIAALALWSSRHTPALFWSWVILSGCFIVDATTTLVRRVSRGDRFYEAHRSHAYQYASRRLGAHRPVTLAVGLINVIWLLPIAALTAAGLLDGLLGVVLAYLPLLWLAFRFKAGDRNAQGDHA